MKKYLVLLFLGILGCASPKYIEKQSEPLSQAAYAVNDSLSDARIDLAWSYSDQILTLVNPPKHRIPISSVYKPQTVTSGKTKTVSVPSSQRILVVPSSYKDDTVIAVDSPEYQDLLKDKAIKNQLAQENITLKAQQLATAKQKAVNDKVQSELLNSYNAATVKIAKQDAAIWHRDFIILFFTLVIGIYVALRVGVALGKITLPFAL